MLLNFRNFTLVTLADFSLQIVAGLILYNVIKIETPTRCFSVNVAKFLRLLFYRTPTMAVFETFYIHYEAQITSAVP